MSKTTVNDNRLRVPPEIWLKYLDACAQEDIDPKSKMTQLIMNWLDQRKHGTGQVHLAPQPIPTQPMRQSQVTSKLLSDDLFS